MSSELHDLSERWFRAWLEKDAATVERLAASDYIYVAPNGMILDRRAILAVIRSPSYRLDHGTRSDVIVRSVGQEAAVVRHRLWAPGRSRAHHSRIAFVVSWSVRNRLENGDS